MDRTVETILGQWRAAETHLEHDPLDPDLQELVATLRDEHAAALDTRAAEVEELRQQRRLAV